MAKNGGLKRDNLANANLEKLNRRRYEQQKLRDTHSKLVKDEFVTIQRLNDEMKRIQIELDMTVRRRSLPVASVEIPKKRRPYDGEKFKPKWHIEKYRFAENADEPPDEQKRSSSGQPKEKPDDYIQRMHDASIRSSWSVSRILGWYRFNASHEHRQAPNTRTESP